MGETFRGIVKIEEMGDFKKISSIHNQALERISGIREIVYLSESCRHMEYMKKQK